MILNNKLYFIYIFLLFRFSDLILTNWVITYFGGYEANPIALYMLNTFHWIGLTLLISIVCLLAILSIKLIPQRMWNKLCYFFWIMCAISFIGPLSNIINIYRSI